MLWTTSYIISQALTIFAYVVLGISFFRCNKREIQVLNIVSCIFFSGGFFLLRAYSGVAMQVIITLHLLVFILLRREKESVFSVALTLAAMTAVAFFTYETPLSMLSVGGSFVYMTSLCQQKSLNFKLLNTASCILWLAYQIYIYSIFGIILEVLLLASTIAGAAREVRQREKILPPEPE
ncbi:MAG: YgjV family protein [Clostridiales bacterium]|nr:YgjV family protein [Clostridiales bacterium]